MPNRGRLWTGNEPPSLLACADGKQAEGSGAQPICGLLRNLFNREPIACAAGGCWRKPAGLGVVSDGDEPVHGASGLRRHGGSHARRAFFPARVQLCFGVGAPGALDAVGHNRAAIRWRRCAKAIASGAPPASSGEPMNIFRGRRYRVSGSACHGHASACPFGSPLPGRGCSSLRAKKQPTAW